MMKVLFVSSLSSYYTHENSSYMQRLHFLKEGLTNLGVQTDIIFLGDHKFGKPALFSPLTFRKININIDDYDFVHAGGLGAAYAFSIINKYHKFKPKLIYDVHGDVIAENELLKQRIVDFSVFYKILQAKIMEYLAIQGCDFFVTCSKPLKNLYVSKGINPEKIEIIYNGVDVEIFKPQDINKHNNDFVVTYAGGFQWYQGISLLIEAAKKVEDKSISFQFIGFREENDVLKNHIKKIFGDRVKLIDAVDRETLVYYLNISDILVIPREKHRALEMAFPTKFAEFISTGKPILLTDVSEVAGLTKKFNCGFVCKPSSDSLAKSIRKMKDLEDSELISMGENGRKVAENCLDKVNICSNYFLILKYWIEVSSHEKFI